MYLQLFPKLLFTILLRYDALEGAGLQSAIPSTVFEYLNTRFDGCGCEYECFASPFNCYKKNVSSSSCGNNGGRFGSAFGDTDAMFGSGGSFFGMDFRKMATRNSGGACFQANPPFASEFIEKMCLRMNEVLSPNDESMKRVPLMFVIFVPAWSESIGWKTLSSSPHLTKHMLLSQKDDVHYYTEGTQHRRRRDKDDGKGNGSHRVASFDTSVFFLQNDAAKEKWNLADGGNEDEKLLKAAFAMKPVDVRSVDEEGSCGKGKKKASAIKKDRPSVEISKPGNTMAAPAKKKKKKNNSPGQTNSDRSKKKRKLMAGGQDEMSILLSMGIMDSEASSLNDVGISTKLKGSGSKQKCVASSAGKPKGSASSKKNRRGRK